MASINGISIRNLKKCESVNGVYYTGTLYSNGNVIGRFNENPTNHSFSCGCGDKTHLLDKAVKEYEGILDGYEWYRSHYNRDWFIRVLVSLCVAEKAWKKGKLLGKPYMMLGQSMLFNSCYYEFAKTAAGAKGLKSFVYISSPQIDSTFVVYRVIKDKSDFDLHISSLSDIKKLSTV